MRSHDTERGWLAATGERVGIDPVYVGYIWKGERPDAAPIDQAIATMGLRDAFFYEPLEHEPHYSDYLATHVVREDVAEMPGVAAYFRRHPHHERFRASVNRHLNSRVGDVAPDLVKAIVRGLEDLEAAETERQ